MAARFFLRKKAVLNKNRLKKDWTPSLAMFFVKDNLDSYLLKKQVQRVMTLTESKYHLSFFVIFHGGLVGNNEILFLFTTAL